MNVDDVQKSNYLLVNVLFLLFVMRQPLPLPLGDKLMDRRYNSQAVLHLVLYLAKQCFT